MKEELMKSFHEKLAEKIGQKFTLSWNTDRKGVVCGWCRLEEPEDILSVAELIKEFGGRVMTISPLNTPNIIPGKAPVDAQNNYAIDEKLINVVINYHFFFQNINITVSITLPDNMRTVRSITPVLKSADWHEREMRELYNIKLQGHPNPKGLFLDEGIHMTDHTMIPLSEALKGASTSTLWERIMEKKGGDKVE